MLARFLLLLFTCWAGASADAVDEKNTLGALEFEVSETRALLALLERKAEQLRSLQTLCGNGGQNDQCAGQLPAAAATAAAAKITAGADRVAAQGGGCDYLLPRRALPITQPLLALALMPMRGRGVVPRRSRATRRGWTGTMQVPLAVDESGTLTAFEPTSGEVLLSFPLGHTASVHAVTADFAEAPLVATAAADGSVHLFNVTLWRDGAMVCGPRPRGRQRPTKQKQQAGGGGIIQEDAGAAATLDVARAKTNDTTTPASSLASGFALVLTLERELHAPSTVGAGETARAAAGALGAARAVLLYKRRAKPLILAAYDRGVRVYRRDGELHFGFDTARPVLSLAVAGRTVAYATPDAVRFFSASRAAALDGACSGGLSELVGLATDPAMPAVLYASTAAGGVLVFRYGAGRGSTVTCTLAQHVSTLPRGGGGGDGAAAAQFRAQPGATQGYMLAFSGRMLSLWNATAFRTEKRVARVGAIGIGGGSGVAREDGGGRALLASAHVAAGGGGRGGRGGGWGAANNAPESLVLLGVPGASSLTLLEVVVPPQDKGTNDLKWLRSPLVMGGLFVVFGTQVFGKKRGGGMGGMGMGGAPGMGGMSAFGGGRNRGRFA